MSKLYRHRKLIKPKNPVQRKKIKPIPPNPTESATDVPNDTVNEAGDTDDFRATFYHSLDTKEKNDYFNQKCLFLNELRKINLLCDVTLVTEDNVEINAHKVVLSCVSQYFFTKFTRYNESRRVLIKGFDSSTLELIMNYAYTSQVSINEDNVEVILQAADYFCIEILKNNCCDYLSKMTTLQNCFHIRSIAELYTCESLLKSCDNFIRKHFSEVMKDERFLDFSLNCLSSIIRDDNLKVPSEMMVYTAMMNWIKYDLEKRQKHLNQLIHHVRLPFLGGHRLMYLWRSEPLFKNTPDFQQLLFNALVEENSLSNSFLNILEGHVPIPRKSYSSNPEMFIIGGFNKSSSLSVDCYDIRSKMWRSVMQLGKSLYGAAAVSTRDKIYVTGGFLSNNYSTNMEIFDMKTKKWIQTASMNSSRAYHAAVLLNNKIYVMGGLNQNNEVLRSVEYYCLKEAKWYVAQNMMEPRVHVTAAVLNEKIYVVGGSRTNSPLQPSDTVEYYDPKTSTWSLCKNMNYGRYGAGVSTVNNLLYVVGGHDSDNFGDKVEAYDPITDNWELMPNLSVPRVFHGVCNENGYLFAVGGEWNGSYISSIEVFCCHMKKWVTMNTELTVARSRLAVVIACKNRD